MALVCVRQLFGPTEYFHDFPRNSSEISPGMSPGVFWQFFQEMLGNLFMRYLGISTGVLQNFLQEILDNSFRNFSEIPSKLPQKVPAGGPGKFILEFPGNSSKKSWRIFPEVPRKIPSEVGWDSHQESFRSSQKLLQETTGTFIRDFPGVPLGVPWDFTESPSGIPRKSPQKFSGNSSEFFREFLHEFLRNSFKSFS